MCVLSKYLQNTLLTTFFVLTIFFQRIDLDIGLCVCSIKYVLGRILWTKPARYRYALLVMKQSI